jgi:AraC-like DNA-binding protein
MADHNNIYPESFTAPIAITVLNSLLAQYNSSGHQAKHISLHQARSFYDNRNKLFKIADQRLPICDLLPLAGIDQIKTFRKVLKELYGFTIHELVIEFRMIEAAKLLQQNQQTIKQIALHTGFSNVYHFTRVFTEFYGEPPKTYQRKYGL